MKEKEVVVEGRKFLVKELKAKQLDDVDFSNTKEVMKIEVQLSTGMDDATYDDLTVRERLAIVDAVHELNFLKPI